LIASSRPCLEAASERLLEEMLVKNAVENLAKVAMAAAVVAAKRVAPKCHVVKLPSELHNDGIRA
jgi:hypothetical protein